jgi:hypothetical protein
MAAVLVDLVLLGLITWFALRFAASGKSVARPTSPA